MVKVARMCIAVLAIYSISMCAMDDALHIKLSNYLAVGKAPCAEGMDDCLLWRYELAKCSDNANSQKKGNLLKLCHVVGPEKIIGIFKGIINSKSKKQLDVKQVMKQARLERVKNSTGKDYYQGLNEIKRFENHTPNYAVVEQSDGEEPKIVMNQHEDLRESLRMILSYPSKILAEDSDEERITRGAVAQFTDYMGNSMYNKNLSCKLAGYLAHNNKKIGTFVVGTGVDGKMVHEGICDALQVKGGYIGRMGSNIANTHQTYWILDE